MYYEFTYSTFPQGTSVPTFELPLSVGDAASLDKVNNLLLASGENAPGPYPEEKELVRSIRARPGESTTVAKLDGPRAITVFRVNPDLSDLARQREILRELVLNITWDDESKPAVQVPLGDFFGTAPGVNHYRSWPMGMTEDGFYSYWYMPFESAAHVELLNEGKEELQLKIKVRHAALSRDISEYGRFNVSWHYGLKGDPARPVDWFFLDAKGPGRFCGVALHVWNPLGGWWGEGDEKFYVDGEKFPSIFGTGTEDYFGYGWCSHEIFERPFHNQTLSVSMNPCAYPTREQSGGWTSNNRWQISDNVPFQESFLGSIEKYFSDERPTRFAATVYWYSASQDKQRPALPPPEQRLFGREQREEELFTLLEDLKGYQGNEPVKPLRDWYESFDGDPVVGRFQDELTLRMAIAEHRAGSTDKGMSMFSSVLSRIKEPFMRRKWGPELRDVLDMKVSDGSAIKPYLVANGDGSTERINYKGYECIQTRRDYGELYIYFAFPSEVKPLDNQTTRRLTIKYCLLGDESQGVRIEYDSAFSDDVPGIYRQVSIMSEEKNTWKEIEVELPLARFSGRQNSRSDMRVSSIGGDVCIAEVFLHPISGIGQTE
jgi:hypothetical protein